MKLISKPKELSGILIFSGPDAFLRVYNKDYSFIDYQITHCDLSITIHDEDMAIYQNEEDYYIDHSPETLGNL